MTNEGIVIRISLEKVSVYSRNTQGVKLISVEDDQSVSTVAIVYKSEDDVETEEDTENNEFNSELEGETAGVLEAESTVNSESEDIAE